MLPNDTNAAPPLGFGSNAGLGACNEKQEMDWQPIKTAPRDGRRVLVWIADKSYTGHAFAKLWFYSTGGRLGGGAEGFNGDWNITHWMPLPPGPQESA